MGNKQSSETPNPLLSEMEADWQATFRDKQDERCDTAHFQQEAARRHKISRLRHDFQDFFQESDEFLRQQHY